MAQTCVSPTTTWRAAGSPTTATGVLLLALAPLPSCPSAPAPQQYTAPLCAVTVFTTPHAVGPPTLMWVKLCPGTGPTGHGASDCGVAAGFPICPAELSPQQ